MSLFGVATQNQDIFTLPQNSKHSDSSSSGVQAPQNIGNKTRKSNTLRNGKYPDFYFYFELIILTDLDVPNSLGLDSSHGSSAKNFPKPTAENPKNLSSSEIVTMSLLISGKKKVLTPKGKEVLGDILGDNPMSNNQV